MERKDLISLLSGPFYENFAGPIARQVCREECVDLLYDIAVNAHRDLCAADRHKVLFRSAYVLEKIFFESPGLFEPHAADFCRTDFAACTDASARRHFAKIMAHLLRTCEPPPDALERIAEAAAEWMLVPDAKVAVKAWAIEVLARCRGRVGWVAESWDDMSEVLQQDATPGVASRLRRHWEKR